MAKSMTGFGRGEASDSSRKVTVEIRSVNHRYLDLNIKLPRKLNAFEAEIRSYLKGRILRGKVDLYVSLEESAEGKEVLQYHPQIAAMYVKNLKEASEALGLEYNLKISDLSRLPDVFEMVDLPEDEEELSSLLMEALALAMERFLRNRTEEGARLTEDLLHKVEEMQGLVGELERRSPEILEEYTTKLKERVHELLGGGHLDENRLAAEIVLYADKICIDEEMVRLKSHVQETIHVLESSEEVGRKLDFIAQEMNREANTILSKSTDVQIAGIGISLKTLIEKIREQIQNLE